ncbi:MAG: hypothetical protein O2894_00960 [Planctomycetota bacterium]|nr:hypothetical protein [Planctomycetota bacterium]
MNDGDYTRSLRAALRTRCAYLLTKEAFLGLPEPHERPFAHDEGIFWCDRTSAVLGPDGSQVCARACGAPGRDCYESPTRL